MTPVSEFEHQEGEFTRRVESANRRRFEGCPTYHIGDVLEPLATVEGVWGINGRTIVETSSDVADPDAPILSADYAVAQAGKAWFILYLTPASDSARKARCYMGRHGCPTYWPREVVAVIRGRGDDRKFVPLTRQLFPGYVLAHIPTRVAPEDLAKGVEPRANGIAGLVSTAGIPIVVPDVIVSRVIERERAGEFDHTDRTSTKVTPKMMDWMVTGGLVIVNTGPFREFTGMIEEVDRERQRITVAVSVFGRAAPIEMDLADVRQPC